MALAAILAKQNGRIKIHAYKHKKKNSENFAKTMLKKNIFIEK